MTRAETTHAESPIERWTWEGITVADLLALTDGDAGPRVSCFLPTADSAADATQDRIRLHNLLTQAANELRELGMEPRNVSKLLAPALALGTDRAITADDAAGLAVLVDDAGVRVIPIPGDTPELVVVGGRFHLKPLLGALRHAPAVDVLVVGLDGARLLRCEPDGTSRAVALDDVPDSIEEFRHHHSEAGHQHQGRGVGRAGGIRRRSDRKANDLRRYLHAVDTAVAHARAATQTPLVLAGLAEVIGEFRSLTHQHQIVEGAVLGNADGLTADELRTRALALVDAQRADDLDRTRDEFLAGRAPTLDTIEQTVAAAAAGHVAAVIVDRDRHCWGDFDPEHHLIVEHDERAPGDQDLSDLAALATLRHGGRAHAVAGDEIPGGGPIAAVLRY